jgi:hypothetical protein
MPFLIDWSAAEPLPDKKWLGDVLPRGGFGGLVSARNYGVKKQFRFKSNFSE